MSIPISICKAWRAAKGDEATFESLVSDMQVNLRYGHWSTFGCSCKPPCVPATDAEMAVLDTRVKAACVGIECEERPGTNGPAGAAPKTGSVPRDWDRRR